MAIVAAHSVATRLCLRLAMSVITLRITALPNCSSDTLNLRFLCYSYPSGLLHRRPTRPQYWPTLLARRNALAR